MSRQVPAGTDQELASRSPSLVPFTGEGGHGNDVSGRKGILLRLDPAVHDALAKWAAGELRSTNAQIEFLLRRALADAARPPNRLPRSAPPG
jgi:hypothetical protein